MKNTLVRKWTAFEIKSSLEEMKKQYGENTVQQMFGENYDRINRDFEKEVAVRLEPYWKDIVNYEHGSFFARLRVMIKYLLHNRRGECGVPKYILEAIVDDMMPDIRAFIESEEGKKEFEEWKAARNKNLADKKKAG